MAKKLTVANLVALIGGVVTVLFSFLDFYKLGDVGRNAWSSDGGAYATTLPVLLALALIVIIVLELAGTKLPPQVLTFNWNQIKATLAISAAGIMLSYLVTDFGGLDKGIGFWLMLLGSLAMAAGTIMTLLGVATNALGAASTGGAGAAPAAPGASGGAPPPPPMGGDAPSPPAAGGPPPPPPVA